MAATCCFCLFICPAAQICLIQGLCNAFEDVRSHQVVLFRRLGHVRNHRPTYPGRVALVHSCTTIRCSRRNLGVCAVVVFRIEIFFGAWVILCFDFKQSLGGTLLVFLARFAVFSQDVLRKNKVVIVLFIVTVRQCDALVAMLSCLKSAMRILVICLDVIEVRTPFTRGTGIFEHAIFCREDFAAAMRCSMTSAMSLGQRNRLGLTKPTTVVCNFSSTARTLKNTLASSDITFSPSFSHPFSWLVRLSTFTSIIFSNLIGLVACVEKLAAINTTPIVRSEMLTGLVLVSTCGPILTCRVFVAVSLLLYHDVLSVEVLPVMLLLASLTVDARAWCGCLLVRRGWCESAGASTVFLAEKPSLLRQFIDVANAVDLGVVSDIGWVLVSIHRSATLSGAGSHFYILNCSDLLS